MQQTPEQAEFRQNYSTVDHLHTVIQIIEKSKEYQLEIVLPLVDYNKAFDSLEYSFLLKSSKNQGIPNKLIKIIKEMYMLQVKSKIG